MTKLIYIGNGAFLPGVPARDLSAAEVKKHNEQELIASGLYKKPAAKKVKVDDGRS